MANTQFFETPENIQVSYQAAGLGKRFVAWLVDAILLIFTFILLIILSLFLTTWVADFFDDLSRNIDPTTGEFSYGMVGFGILILTWGAGSFAYFFLNELLLRGQTAGKRSAGIRVAKADGFSLDPFSVFLRNIVRIVDNPFTGVWVVALFTKNNRRIGDILAGTVVLEDQKVELSEVRQKLANQSALDAQFTFDYTRLEKITPEQFGKIETILERLNSLPIYQKRDVLQMVVLPLAQQIDVDPPKETEYQLFLEQLLAAEYRRQNRSLG